MIADPSSVMLMDYRKGARLAVEENIEGSPSRTFERVLDEARSEIVSYIDTWGHNCERTTECRSRPE